MQRDQPSACDGALTGLPQNGQTWALSATCFPQWLQYIVITSASFSLSEWFAISLTFSFHWWEMIRSPFWRSSGWSYPFQLSSLSPLHGPLYPWNEWERGEVVKFEKIFEKILEGRMTFHKIIAEDTLNFSISWQFSQPFNILQKVYKIVRSCGKAKGYLQNLEEKRSAL